MATMVAMAMAPDEIRSNHAVIAAWLRSWAVENEQYPRRPPEWTAGYVEALTEVADHLERGDLAPGGVVHDEEVGVAWP
ncbi:MAG: hypothetical protein JJU45_15200 [Acidimicrobiia bacterium]|nr:hypothetical protein [Acidimicrobiia bacterium]